jgi:hypothetical protein
MSEYLIAWWSRMSVEIYDGAKHGKLDRPLMQNRVDTCQHQLSPPRKISSVAEPLGSQVSLVVWCPEHA